MTQEDAPGVVSAGAYSVQDVLETMALVSDPEWQVHRVVMTTLYRDAEVESAMLRVGLLGGAQSMTLSEEGRPRAWWDVVAPSETDAVKWSRDAVAHLAPHKVDLDSIHVNNKVPER